MQETSFDQITVQAIVDRADIGRTTFYTQFQNKEQVLECELERVFGQIHAQDHAAAADPASQVLPVLGFFRHVQETRPLCLALIRGLASDPHYLAVHRTLRDQAVRQLSSQRGAQAPAVPPEIVADYLAGAMLTMARWWLDRGLPYTPEEMERYFQRLVTPGLDAALGRRT